MGHARRRETASGNSAFTLLEVIVALAILAIALTTLFGAQSGSLSLATEAKFNTTAALLADLKLAELESSRLAAVDAQGAFGGEFPGYTWKLEVRDVADQVAIPRGKIIRVDLTVSWASTHYRYDLRCYIRKEGKP